MTYINGIRATKKDIETLKNHIQNGFIKSITIKQTPKGATALTVED